MNDDLIFILGIAAAIFAAFAILLFALKGNSPKKDIEDRASHLTSRVHSNPKAVAIAQATLKKQMAESQLPWIDGLVSRLPSIDVLQQRLDRTGKNITAGYYITVNIAIIIGVLFVMTVMLHKPITLALPIGIVVGVGIPHKLVGRWATKRMNNFIRLFPDAIELIVRGLRSGLPMQEGLKVVAEEINSPVREEFKHISELIALGINVDEALKSTAERLKISEFNFFVTSIILQRETGGNLAEILSNIAETIRDRHMMKMKIKALSSEARASALIVGALPLMVAGAIQFITPDYLTIMFEDFRGNLMLAAAGGSLLTGFLVMHKMSNFEI